MTTFTNGLIKIGRVTSSLEYNIRLDNIIIKPAISVRGK